MLLIVLSTMSALFSIYITVQTGVAVSSGDCNPLLYPCELLINFTLLQSMIEIAPFIGENWRGIEWALMAFSVVAFTEATFIAFLSSIAFLIDAEASRKETRESNVSLDLPTIRSDAA